MSETTHDLLQHGFRYAYSLCHQRADAEDLVHDAWIKLSNRNHAINKALLFTSIRNLFIDQYRRSNLISIDVDLQVSDLPVNEISFEAPISTNALNNALALLRPSEREILFLHSVEEYTATEIAQLIQSSRGTVLSSIFRSKRKLKKLLSTHYQESLDIASGDHQ